MALPLREYDVLLASDTCLDFIIDSSQRKITAALAETFYLPCC